MTEVLAKQFDKKDFKPEKYVQDLVQECVAGSELQQRKSKIQTFSDQTSSQLKKHVYANYMQFIETSKEISHLESEMYQLSHLLSEQRNLLSILSEDCNNGIDQDKFVGCNNQEGIEIEEVNDAQTQAAIRTVKEMVHGFTLNLENKTFLNEGGLIELDSNDYRPIQRVYFFLFSDIYIMCKVKHDKKLEFLAQHDPTKIAVINIKDFDGVKNAINIISPDGSKIFQCITTATKSEWIEKFETAVKFNQTKHRKDPAPKLPPQIEKTPPSTTVSDVRSILSQSSLSPGGNDSVSENWGPEWLLPAPEEIQALIAQRHFEDALTLIQKSETYLQSDSKFWNAAEITGKVKLLKTNLGNVLIQELSYSQNKDMPAALRSSRRPLKLLVEIGNARDACKTLLIVCSAAIKRTQRMARRNNLKISDLFFCDLAQAASEFLRVFDSQPACISSLVVWCNMELVYFSNQLVRHYLVKGCQLEAAASYIEGVRKPCFELKSIGLDLSYRIEGLLRNAIAEVLDDSRYRLLESIGRTEDTWQPYNVQTKSNINSLLRDLDVLGIDMKACVIGDTWINLTQSTVNFCRHFLSVTESCAYLAKNETLQESSELLLKDLFVSQYSLKPSPGFPIDLNFVERNKVYLIEELLPVASKKFEKISKRQTNLLVGVRKELKIPPKPKPRSVYQTDVL